MPQTQVHSPGKGREASRQKVLNLSFKIQYGLTVHIIRFNNFFTGKIFTAKLSHQVKFQRITQIPRNSPTPSANDAKFAPFIHICFRCLTSGRERRKIPAKQVKFARFAPIHRELREFRALRTKLTHM